MFTNQCPICKSVQIIGLRDWHRECQNCGYESADFTPSINQINSHDQIDESSRESGLSFLRIKNFKILVKAIKKTVKPTGKLLDVGCAHGWFLQVAKDEGFKVLGIEPDINIYNATLKKGLPVKQGYFPQVLGSNESFDVIVFNDVFEHSPDLKNLLLQSKKHISSGGLLILNLPSSQGIFYKTSRLLCKLGFESFFERLWQKDLPSPHLHYFNSKNLRQLLQSNGFDVIASGRLPVLTLRGLFTRISYTGNQLLLIRVLLFFGVLMVLPFLRLMPSDIVYLISKERS